MNKINYEQALQRLAAYCSRSERCISDVCRKLDALEIPADWQKRIIQHLQKEKFLDENRFCKAFVNDKAKYNRWGIDRIRFELRKKQISEPLVCEALKALDPEESMERLRILIEQKKKSVKGKNEWEIRQKLMRFAASRGFSLEDFVTCDK